MHMLEKTNRKPSGNVAMLNEWTSEFKWNQRQRMGQSGSVHALMCVKLLRLGLWIIMCSRSPSKWWIIHHLKTTLIYVSSLHISHYITYVQPLGLIQISAVKHLKLKIISRLTYNLRGLWHQHNVSFFSGLRVSWEYAQNVMTNECQSSGSLKVCRCSAQITRKSCTTLRCHDLALIVANMLMPR